MNKWEYRTLYIEWQETKDSRGKKYHNWVAEFADGPSIEGLNAILNNEGNSGWELVNLIPQNLGYQNSAVVGYRAVFKRMLKEQA